MTPLHWAAQNGHVDVVKVLLKHYAQTSVVNKFDLTPADIAAQINRLDIVSLINKRSEEGDDPPNVEQHLTLELVENEMDDLSQSDSPIPLGMLMRLSRSRGSDCVFFFQKRF